MSDKPRVPPPGPPPGPPPVPPANGQPASFQDVPSLAGLDAIELDRTPLLVAPDGSEVPEYEPDPEPEVPLQLATAPAASVRKPLRVSPILWLCSGVVAVAAASAFSWSAFHKPVAAAPPAAPASPVREIRAAKIGFSLLVDSKPTGATVFVDGKDVGRTPALLNLECTPGIDVAVRVEREGYETFTHTGECKTDAILTLKPKLKRRP